VPATISGGILYAVLAVACIGRVPHFEWLVLGAQCAILLPALVYALARRGADAPASPIRIPDRKVVLIAFLVSAAAASCWLTPGTMIPDETSYYFQARVLASGRLVAQAPPGAAKIPADTPAPLVYNHHVLRASGWFSRYPLGWPAVLSIGERLHAPWLMNPLLGGILLAITAAIARRAFGCRTRDAALWFAALSPYFFANSIGLMSHVTCGVLIAAACLCCFEGIRSRRMTPLAWMLGALALTFHIRPYSGFIAACVLGVASLAALRCERAVLIRFALMATAFGLAACTSVLLYNKVFTGAYWLSPYALLPDWAKLYPGFSVPGELRIILKNISRNLRFSSQSTLLYTFPFLFPLAVWGFWKERKRFDARILALLFPAFALGHLIQPESSGSYIGERYWFEAFFAVAILGARGFILLMESWRPERSAGAAAAWVLTGVQIAVLGAALHVMDSHSRPYRQVRSVAESYRNCACVVFLHPGARFVPAHFNLNGPDWKTGGVFYLIDPGSAERAAWARRFGRRDWAVIGYDPDRDAAFGEFYRDGIRAPRPAFARP
jgi:hypothetical protein